MEGSDDIETLLGQLVDAISNGNWMALIPIVLTIVGVIITIVVRNKKKQAAKPVPPVSGDDLK